MLFGQDAAGFPEAFHSFLLDSVGRRCMLVVSESARSRLYAYILGVLKEFLFSLF